MFLGLIFLRLSESTLMIPRVGSISLRRSFAIVVLPAPDGHESTTSSPEPISKLISPRALVPLPKVFVTLSKMSILFVISSQ